MTIWERRVELDRQEQAELLAILAPHNAKYLELRRLLIEECAAEGHSLRFHSLTAGGDELQRCLMCGFLAVTHD